MTPIGLNASDEGNLISIQLACYEFSGPEK